VFSLRDYQVAAIAKARSAVGQGARALCLVCPTGGGKTVLGAEIVRSAVSRGHRAIWLAHRTELVDQAAETLERLGLTVGVIAAASVRRPQPYAPVQVASLATLVSRGDTPEAGLLVFDECHHATASTYAAILARYSSSIRIGLTATPERGDGTGLGEMFQRLITVARIRELIDQGHLVNCELITTPKLLPPGSVAQRPVDAYHEHAAGRSAIVFAAGIKHAATIAHEFGTMARVIDAKTPAIERASTLRDFRSGALRVLVNCMVLTEGFDAPIASAAILARGCGTTGLYLQVAGRVLRPYPGKASAVLVDLRGVSHLHGHPCDDREYSLEGRGIRREQDDTAPGTFCRVCGAPTTPGEPCEECGAAAREPKPLTVTGDKLVRYAHLKTFTPDQRARMLATLLRKSKSSKQARTIYYKMNGHWPSADLERAARALT